MESRVMNKIKKREVGGWKNNPLLFVGPYAFLFLIFIVLPVIGATLLSLTDFNGFQWPGFVGLSNFVSIFTGDQIFMQHALPVTISFALIVGPVGYFLAFMLAWSLAQVSPAPRAVLALLIYSPSMVGAVAMAVVWGVMFSGHSDGFINSLLLQWGIIATPIQFTQDPNWLFPIMVIVSLWNSMGLGFLAMLAGVLNINPEYYEAAYVDGLNNRFQEIVFVTIPSMKPQMLFGAVMSLVGTFQAGSIGVQLSGSNPTPLYAGHTIMNHMEDFGFIRFEMGYAAALAVLLLVMIYVTSRFVWRILGEKQEY